LIENSNPARQKLMKKAFQLGRKKFNKDLGLLENLQFRLLDGIVLSKVRDRFGGNLRHGFCAGAAVPKEVLAFMDDIGIPIYEGYGLTETSPIIALNVPGKRKVGAVGAPLKGVSVIIADEKGNPSPEGTEGEICCYGPNVMKGYYNNQKATDEVMTLAPDGVSRLFHTGDLGKLGSDGFIHVTGRLKEQYKLENGKYICPTPIEEAIGMSRFIMQVVLCGANRPYNVALLVLDWAAIRTELNISNETSEEELANDKRVKRLIDYEIEATCSGKLKKFEIPQEWAMVAPFTAANNMLTPKLSIRRHMVMKTYEDVIAGLYNDRVAASAVDGAVEEKVA
jgi:long-chain acyl-CoA synthetase